MFQAIRVYLCLAPASALLTGWEIRASETADEVGRSLFLSEDTSSNVARIAKRNIWFL